MTYFAPKTYELQSENQPWSYGTDGMNQRFEVRSGDNWTWDGTAKERSEIASYKKLAFGQTYTISYKFMVEPGQTNSADWLLIGQVHQTEDPGEPGLSPPLAIEMAGERLRIVARSSAEAISSSATTSTKTLWSDSAALERGRWYDMTLEMRFDPFGGGLLNVWRDGQKIVSYAGAIGYNDQVGGYWKQGVYREASPETFAVNFSNLNVAEKPSPGAAATAGPDIFRFFNTSNGSHFYTANAAERDSIISKLPQYRYEGNAFDTTATAATGDEVFRFFNTSNSTHFYTISEAERDSIIARLPHYKYEGAAYYAYETNVGGAHEELYRFFNTSNGTHFYTTSETERDSIMASLKHYKYEGIAYYVDLA
jgi:hypothetical protein